MDGSSVDPIKNKRSHKNMIANLCLAVKLILIMELPFFPSSSCFILLLWWMRVQAVKRTVRLRPFVKDRWLESACRSQVWLTSSFWQRCHYYLSQSCLSAKSGCHSVTRGQPAGDVDWPPGRGSNYSQHQGNWRCSPLSLGTLGFDSKEPEIHFARACLFLKRKKSTMNHFWGCNQEGRIYQDISYSHTRDVVFWNTHVLPLKLLFRASKLRRSGRFWKRLICLKTQS